jgi:hypothetical protein
MERGRRWRRRHWQKQQQVSKLTPLLKERWMQQQRVLRGMRQRCSRMWLMMTPCWQALGRRRSRRRGAHPPQQQQQQQAQEAMQE